MMEDKKYKDLINYLKSLGSVVVAFSGGVDSTFLLQAAKEALGEKVMAITVVSPYIPKWEIQEAKDLVKKIGVKHKLLEVPVILDEIKFNPENRCYLCKKFIFSSILNFKKEVGFKYVIDGTNLDDTKDYRPGMKALKELGVISPLLENKITKEEIRKFSKKLDLETWNKPAYACLLSRIPYGQEITEDTLRKIEKAEVYLMTLGFKGLRVRCHGDLARIELPKNQIFNILSEGVADKISFKLKEIGFKYITLDLSGYKMGSLNSEEMKNSMKKL